MKEQVIADRYKVLSKLGSGGSAVVYKVLDLTLNKECALKTIKVREADSRLLVRFQREAKAVSSLRHPSIVSVLDFGLDKLNNPFLVMDYVEGQSLKEYLKTAGPLSIEQFLQISIQICDAMIYIHQHKILHRDLKSANIMVKSSSDHKKNDPNQSEELFVQILDFGLAKDTQGKNEESLTQTGVSIGTPTYMSPEQASGKELDERSEVYSLGCVFFECLTGKLPIVGATVFETINKQINEEAPSLASIAGEEFPPIIESIISRAMKKNPDDRFQSMAEIKENLENVVELIQPNYDASAENQDVEPSKVPFKVGNPSPKILILFIAILLAVSIAVVSHINNLKKQSQADAKKIEDLSHINIFGNAHWELGLTWHEKHNTTDNDLLRLRPTHNIKNLALYEEKGFTDKGLKHALSLPLIGIGYGNSGLTRNQLKMTVEAKPNLEHLYIGGIPVLKDEDLRLVSKLQELSFLGISRSNFSDEALRYVAKLRNLDTLKATRNKNMNGTGFKYLIGHPKLRRIALGENNFSQKGWTELSKLVNLTLVSLPATNLSDQNIHLLTKLPNLEKLDIRYCTQLTDTGFIQLKQLKNLKLILVRNCPGITTRALSQLKRALPDCVIEVGKQMNFEDGDPLLLREKLPKKIGAGEK